MNSNNLKALIEKIYNEGLFEYENNQEKSEEMIKLEQITKYKNVNELFFSDLGPEYIYNTILLYESITSKDISEKEYLVGEKHRFFGFYCRSGGRIGTLVPQIEFVVDLMHIRLYQITLCSIGFLSINKHFDGHFEIHRIRSRISN